MKALFTVVALLLLRGLGTPIFAADAAGVWTGRITVGVPDRDEMPRDVTLTLKADGSSLTGTLSMTWDGHRDSTEILDGKVNGDEVSFAVPTGASDMPRMNFQGKQDGDDLKLAITGKNPKDGQEWKLGDGLLKRAK